MCSGTNPTKKPSISTIYGSTKNKIFIRENLKAEIEMRIQAVQSLQNQLPLEMEESY